MLLFQVDCELRRIKRIPTYPTSTISRSQNILYWFQTYYFVDDGSAFSTNNLYRWI